jgi:hypothetical protein
MNPNQALWEKGDFTAIAATMRASGEALVRDQPVALARAQNKADRGWNMPSTFMHVTVRR